MLECDKYLLVTVSPDRASTALTAHESWEEPGLG
jgi:hypothetical protein